MFDMFPNKRGLRMLRTRKTLDEMLAFTMKKQNYLRSLDINVVSSWVQDFVQFNCRQSRGVRICDLIRLKRKTATPRRIFRGGGEERTNAVKVYKKAEQIQIFRFFFPTSFRQ